MFTVKECTKEQTACADCPDENACALCARFGADAKPGDRVFVLTEGSPRAVGVLALRGGKVLVKGVWGEIDDSYRDLMYRSLLHVCRCMRPITVRVESDEKYFDRFGFLPADGGKEVLNTQIKF